MIAKFPNIVTPIKDYYENVKGGKKIKVLTKGKKYNYIKNIVGDLTIINDFNITSSYRKSLFRVVSKLELRNEKLNDLGI
jgi:hypothetical protein